MKTRRYETERTTTQIKKENESIVVLPYGSQLYNIMTSFDGITGYNTGIYGWNFDVIETIAYNESTNEFVRVAICSGYRNIPKATHEIVSTSIDDIKEARDMWDRQHDFIKAVDYYHSITLRIKEI